MNKWSVFSLLTLSTVATLSGCTLTRETEDLADQTETVLAFDLSIDDYIPAALKVENFTDSGATPTIQNLTVDLNNNPTGDTEDEEEPAMGTQLSEFQWAYQGIRSHLNGLEKIREKKNDMINAMRGITPFKRGGVFKNVLNQIDYEVVVEGGFTTLAVNFDLGNYQITQGSNEDGSAFYQGSYTNPYGGVITFFVTDDSLKISFDPIQTEVNTYLSFTKNADSISGELARYTLDAEGDLLTVLNSGVAQFNADYTYVLYDLNNDIGLAKDFSEIEVYSTTDAKFLFSRELYTIDETQFDVFSYPLAQLSGYENVTLETKWKKGFYPTYYVDETEFPAFTDMLSGLSPYGLSVRGKYRFTSHNGSLASRKLDFFYLNILKSEEEVNGLPLPFSFSDQNLELAKEGTDALLTQHEEFLNRLTPSYVVIDVLPISDTPVNDEEQPIVS